MSSCRMNDDGESKEMRKRFTVYVQSTSFQWRGREDKKILILLPLHLFLTARSAQSLFRQNMETCIRRHGSPSGFKWLKGPVSVKVSSQRERGFRWRRALTSAAAFTLTVPNTESLQPPFRFLSFFFDRFQRLVIFLLLTFAVLNLHHLARVFFLTHRSTSSHLVKFQLISEKNGHMRKKQVLF